MDSATNLATHNARKRLKIDSASWFTVWRVVSLLAILHLAVFDLLILTAPEIIQVQYTPDDGYYYLALARNFVRFGEWTFDGGVSVTSGFHLMQAYLLVFIYKLFQPTPENFVRLGLVLSALTTMIVVLFTWQILLRKKETLFLIVFTILISARSFLFNSVSVTEWSLVVLIAGLYCYYFYDGNGQRNILIPFILGLLGSLARTDFGLLPFSVFMAAWLVVSRTRKSFPIRAAVAGLLGALAGVGLVFLHNFITTGTFLQSSALMKSYWAQFASQQFYSAATLGLQALGMDLGMADYQRSIFLLTLLGISGPIILIVLAKISGQNNLPLSIFRLDPDRPSHERVLVFAAALSLVGYTILYTLSGTIQNWYTANLILPVFILFAAGARYLHRRILGEYHFVIVWLSVFVLIAMVVQAASLYPLGGERAPWPHQQFLLEAGRSLQQNPVDGYTGAWNAGIAGYYQGGTGIINIDGLVNNDVYPYVVANNLPAYLHEKDIRYILDFENMFHPPFTARGGYDDANFLARLTPIKTFDQGEFMEFKFLRLYRIEP